jgi:uncharacterized membrane protein
MQSRNDAMVNGALIAIGALGVADNIVVHWLLQLHRAVPGEHALAVEGGLIAGSLVLLVIGFIRERRARRQQT